jgi:hypothetical protein
MSIRPTLLRSLNARKAIAVRGISSTGPKRAGHQESHSEDDSTHTHECTFVHYKLWSITDRVSPTYHVYLSSPLNYHTVHELAPSLRSVARSHNSLPIPTMAKHPNPHNSLNPNLPLPPIPI